MRFRNTSCSHWSNSFASQGLFTKKVNRKYEEINEKSVETEFEFLTEEEMELKGWSESLRLIAGLRVVLLKTLNPKP